MSCTTSLFKNILAGTPRGMINPLSALLVAMPLLAGASDIPQTPPEPLPTPPEASYPTVGDALKTLSAQPQAKLTVTQPDGWIIIDGPQIDGIWTFTPRGHYAYPAVVHRAMKKNPAGGSYVEISSICEASAKACERLIEEFRVLNERMRKDGH